MEERKKVCRKCIEEFADFVDDLRFGVTNYYERDAEGVLVSVRNMHRSGERLAKATCIKRETHADLEAALDSMWGGALRRDWEAVREAIDDKLIPLRSKILDEVTDACLEKIEKTYIG